MLSGYKTQLSSITMPVLAESVGLHPTLSSTGVWPPSARWSVAGGAAADAASPVRPTAAGAATPDRWIDDGGGSARAESSHTISLPVEVSIHGVR
jgi:hypothetical protein